VFLADSRRAFGSSYPPKADPEVLAKFPSREPSDPDLVPAYERGQLQLLRLLFEHLPDGVVGTDPGGLITEANPAAREIFGRSAEELEGKPIFEYLVDEYGAPLTQVIGREIERFRFISKRNVYVVRPDGSRRSCTLCAGPLVHEGNILRAFGIFRDRTELEELVQIDEKTGLLNERTFLQRVEEHILFARKKNLPLAMIYFDLRGFKPVNDRFGHAEGDRVLKKVGKILEETSQLVDFKSRLHGDEFAVLLQGSDHEGVEIAASRLARVMAFEIDLVDPVSGDMVSIPICADIGVCWRQGGEIPDAKVLLERADKRMYACKEAARRGEPRPFCIDD
jgi:diguanylate cyclase (GGDEF)-like protein/PAS domain S-box-containing protein